MECALAREKGLLDMTEKIESSAAAERAAAERSERSEAKVACAAAEKVARSVEQLRVARDEISAEQACTADLRLDLAEAKQGAAVEAAKLDARNEAEVPHTLFGF